MLEAVPAFTAHHAVLYAFIGLGVVVACTIAAWRGRPPRPPAPKPVNLKDWLGKLTDAEKIELGTEASNIMRARQKRFQARSLAPAE